jgi:hypothetical protein
MIYFIGVPDSISAMQLVFWVADNFHGLRLKITRTVWERYCKEEKTG